MTMRFQLFEQFVNTGKPFEADVAKDKVFVTIYQEPTPYKNATIDKGKIFWELPLYQKEWGIEMAETATIYSMELVFDVEDDDGDGSHPVNIEVKKDIFKPEQFKTMINNFPLILNQVEITMRHSTDPEDWKIELVIGPFNNK